MTFMEKFTSKLQWLHCSHYDHCYHCTVVEISVSHNKYTGCFLSELAHAKCADVLCCLCFSYMHVRRFSKVYPSLNEHNTFSILHFYLLQAKLKHKHSLLQSSLSLVVGCSVSWMHGEQLAASVLAGHVLIWAYL